MGLSRLALLGERLLWEGAFVGGPSGPMLLFQIAAT
ncbi:DUF6053 domain-containing protein [Lysobacter enzymogenes]